MLQNSQRSPPYRHRHYDPTPIITSHVVNFARGIMNQSEQPLESYRHPSVPRVPARHGQSLIFPFGGRVAFDETESILRFERSPLLAGTGVLRFAVFVGVARRRRRIQASNHVSPSTKIGVGVSLFQRLQAQLGLDRVTLEVIDV